MSLIPKLIKGGLRMSESMESHNILKYDGHELIELEDDIAVEFPLTLQVDGEEFATIVCTPTHLEELIIGFLASEGIIRFKHDIHSFSIDKNRGFAYIDLKKKELITKKQHLKRFIGSCCGKSRQFYFQNDARTAKTITSNLKISIEQCSKLMGQMQQESVDFQLTGGLHNAALCDNNGVIVSREDIGRHNAMDKLYGYCMNNSISLKDKVIVVSGRISSEMLLKTAKIGIGVILSKAAPTTLAIKLANDLGITTVGFIRGQRLNIYSHPERITIQNN